MSSKPAKNPHSVGEILDDLGELAEEKNEVCVGDLLDRYGNRSFGPMLLIPPLLEISPVGAIPGVPSFLAAIVALVALQLAFGREHLWFPNFIENRSIRSSKLRKASEKLSGIGKFFDKLFSRRFAFLTAKPFPQLAALFILALCCTVPPLEFLPFASRGPMLAIVLFGLALITRDGFIMMAAFVATAAAFGIGAYLYMIEG